MSQDIITLINEFAGAELQALGSDPIIRQIAASLLPNAGWIGRDGLPRRDLDEDTIASELEHVIMQVRNNAVQLIVKARRMLSLINSVNTLELHYRECIVSANLAEESRRSEEYGKCELIRRQLESESNRVSNIVLSFLNEYGLTAASLNDAVDAIYELIFKIQATAAMVIDAVSYSILVSVTPLISEGFGPQASIGYTAPTPQPATVPQQAQPQQGQQGNQPQQPRNLLEALFASRRQQQGGS